MQPDLFGWHLRTPRQLENLRRRARHNRAVRAHKAIGGDAHAAAIKAHLEARLAISYGKGRWYEERAAEAAAISSDAWRAI